MYIAFDQYGNNFHIEKHPRKELLKKLCRSRASKMYTDTPHGAKYIGYVIADHWLTVYKLVDAFAK